MKNADQWLTELANRTSEFKRGSDTACELRAMIAHIQADAIAHEREECAKLVEGMQENIGTYAWTVPRAIRRPRD